MRICRARRGTLHTLIRGEQGCGVPLPKERGADLRDSESFHSSSRNGLPPSIISSENEIGGVSS